MHNQWIFYLIVFMLTLMIVYFVTYSVIALVDQKIGDIRIQMPKIEITPQPRPHTEYFESASPTTQAGIASGTGTGGNVGGNIKNNAGSSPSEFDMLDKKFSLNGENTHEKDLFAARSELKHNELLKGEPGVIDLKTLDPEIDDAQNSNIGCQQDSDCNIVNGDGKNICKRNGKCYCLSGSGLFCQYGPTNYKDPKDMTPDELAVFKAKYRNNFTLQDYKNWLLLYRADAQHLRYNHRENLKILLRGGQLTDRDLPNVSIKPPMDAASYFQKMYEGGKVSVHFPEESATGAMLGYNYNKFSDFIPPEETENTWITGVVDMYRQPQKDDAKALNYYLRPDTTVGADRELVGQEYLDTVKNFHNLADLRKQTIANTGILKVEALPKARPIPV